jgi:hypothetical protein
MIYKQEVLAFLGLSDMYSDVRGVRANVLGERARATPHLNGMARPLEYSRLSAGDLTAYYGLEQIQPHV